MGADIHLFIERKRSINGVEKWVNNDHWLYNPYYKEEDPDGESKMKLVSAYDGRNYDLFGILANVRNYSDNGCICKPKGLPEDVSDIVKAESEMWGGDGHSHSYFTLRELKEYLKQHPSMKRSGMVSPESAKKLDEGTDTPDSWAQWTNPDINWEYREWDEPSTLKHFVDKINERFKEEFWIFDDNEHPEHEENFRIVFWFDN